MVSNSTRLLIGAAMLAAPMLAFGQANLRVTAATSTQVVTQTRPAVVTFSTFNDGPGTATSVVATNLFAFPGSNVSLTVLNACPLTVSGPVATPTLTWTIGDLGSGQSRSCSVEVRALPTSQNQNFRFAMRASSGTIDPFPNNNAGGVELSISAADVVSDLSIEIELAPANGLVPTDGSGRIYVTVSNNGPDDAAFARVTSDSYPRPLEIPPPFVIFGVPEDPCQTFIDTESGSSQVSTGPAGALAAGASITCVLGIERRAGATNGTYTLGFIVALGGFGHLDPNLLNNSAAVGLGISVIGIPAASLPTLLTLAMLLAFAGAVLLRSERRSDAQPKL